MPDAVLPTENGERLPYALEAEGLSLGFAAPPTDDSRPETRGKAVISDLTLRLEAGSYTVLVGPSGCGKTTLAQAICAVFTSAMNGWLRGSLTVDGTDLTALGPGEVARHVAFVWQQPDGQMCSRSVLGEASLPLDYLCVSAAEGDARAREALSRVGLSHLAETRDPLTLSGGEQQRLALAAAIVQGAKVLVLDEATSALDTSAQEQFRAALRQVCADRQLTVLAIDHRPENHAGLADRLLVLDASGRLVRDGDFNSLLGGDCAFLAELGIRVPGEDYAGATRPAVFPTKADTPPVLTARKLSYRLGRSGETLLEPVSFTLHRGDLLYMYGENGAGKTTLLNCLAGALSPGRNVGPALPQRIADGIAWVNQRSPQLQAGRNVAEEMARAASRGAVGTLAELSSVQREEVTGLLEALGLADTLEMSPLRLSGGMRQRLSFAAALVSHPALLLLDEPTSAQDARGTASILRLLADYRTDLACVLVTHDDAFARAAVPSQRLHLLRPENSEAGATGSQKKGVKKTPQVPGRVSSLLHPLALLVCTVAVWAAAARRTSPPELALLIGVLLTIGLVSALRNRGIGIYLLQLLVVGAACTVTWLGFLPWVQVPQSDGPGWFSPDRAAAALKPAAQLASLGLAAVLFLPRIYWPELVDTLVGTFKVPYRGLDVAIYGNRFKERIRRDWRAAKYLRVLRSRKRGGWRRSLSMFPLVLVASFQDSERLADALDGRGFGALPTRTLRHHRRFRVRDFAACAALIAFLVFLPQVAAVLP